MILGIMQPYLFPYIGYWQLLNAVDKYIIYDDVNYIKSGFINRNNILLNEKAHWITLEVKGASSNKKINELEIGNNAIKIFKTIEQCYRKAPFFNEVIKVIENILCHDEKNLALFVGNSLFKISSYLEINTTIEYSSQLDKDNSLAAQDKVIDICKITGANHYINAIGGKSLYDENVFAGNGVKISFLKTIPIKYKQFSENFIHNLSIIDILMFRSKNEIQDHLRLFDLI